MKSKVIQRKSFCVVFENGKARVIDTQETLRFGNGVPIPTPADYERMKERHRQHRLEMRKLQLELESRPNKGATKRRKAA